MDAVPTFFVFLRGITYQKGFLCRGGIYPARCIPTERDILPKIAAKKYLRVLKKHDILGVSFDEVGALYKQHPNKVSSEDKTFADNSILSLGLLGQGRWGCRVFAHLVGETARFVRGALKRHRELSGKHHSEFFIPLDVILLAVRGDDRVQSGWTVQQHRPCTSAAPDVLSWIRLRRIFLFMRLVDNDAG